MRIKLLPRDFRVEERIELPAKQGGPTPYAYYRVEKEGVSTLAVRNSMAARLRVSPRDLVFPALKDKGAITVQYASVRAQEPDEVRGRGYLARRVAWGPRPLRPTDLRGNHFAVVVRDLSADEARALEPVMSSLAAYGLPNYFDDQRFGSLTRDGFPGKEILKRDAERVVHMYLAEPMAGDRREVRRFKRIAANHWGEWAYLMEQAPRPSNYRSVMTYLKDHPEGFRKAANLIQNRLLAIFLSAYQSWVWNRIVGAYLAQTFDAPYELRIMREMFPLPEPGPELPALEEIRVDLPRLTARYRGPFKAAAAAVLDDEGLEIRDFKARILKRAYLGKGERPVTMRPAEVAVDPPAPDEEHAGQWRVTVSFALGSGRYATLVMKAAAALVGGPIRVR
jgi:tRNA pseudouridine13 synthase